MVNSVLDEILTAAFGSVEKKLNGKTFPLYFCTSEMVAEELLQPYLKDMDHGNELYDFLKKVKNESETSKVLVDCLVRTAFLMMMYVCTERESKWALHLYARSEMLPYFFSVGHHHYVRYST